MRGVRIGLADPTPELRYAAGFLAVSAGFRPEIVSADADRLDVVHGAASGASAPIVIPARPDHQAWPELIDGRVAADAVDGRMPVDILSATIAHLTDAVHRGVPPSAIDGHGRLRFDYSFAATEGLGYTPFVNALATTFGSLIERTTGIAPLPRWPDGRRAAIGLSHDVDRPDKYAILRAVRSGRLMRPRALPYYVGRTLRDFVRWTRDPNRNDFWLFDRVMDLERAAGVTSSFMFATMPAYGRYGSTNDVLYDASWPSFRAVFERLKREGFDIGLHASYNAFAGDGRIAEEKASLEALTGVPAIGVRHHYWHLGPDEARTLRQHEAAGFRYDSSLAFNDHPGFRRGVALPWRPWDASAMRALRVLQLPVASLDSALMQRVPDEGPASDELGRVVAAVKASGGLGVLDWHVRASAPANREFRAWGETYLRTLEAIAGDDELWVTDLARITQWVEGRELRLQPPDVPRGPR